MLMLQDFTTVSMNTTDPTFPAWRLSTVKASVVYALNNKWSLQVGLFSTVWTVKTNTEHGVALASGGIFEGAFVPGLISQVGRTGFDPERTFRLIALTDGMRPAAAPLFGRHAD